MFNESPATNGHTVGTSIIYRYDGVQPGHEEVAR